jgi:AmmeMemoRadiSam system protein A
MIGEARQGQILLHHARAALAAALHHAPFLSLPLTAEESAWLETPGATFVTLMKDGALRGCIGTLEPRAALAEDVARNACSAAFEDPRFPPVTAEEYPSLRVEVSLLSRPEALPPCPDQASAEALLHPGEDGIVLQCGPHRATFLPQVWEALPEPTDFLHRLKQKAGLPPAAWPSDIQLWRYAVRKWGERQEPERKD